MRCYSSKCPLGVATTCTDALISYRGLLFSFLQPLSPTPTPFFLSYCRVVDDITQDDPTWLFWTDSKLGNKPFLVSNLPCFKVRQSYKILPEDQT